MTDAIILAAGNSKRFGKDNKLFTDFNSSLLITHVVSEICKSKLRNIIVITGKDHVKINKLLKKMHEENWILFFEHDPSFQACTINWDGNKYNKKDSVTING